ncbi:MAG: adenylate/guanylate cyclase domain-containing protein [Burkholderiaceae bacterium]|nr:MAG: adenylate/guanylate cyclase domain-containing protein [Burkholderiaceae bacterium]
MQRKSQRVLSLSLAIILAVCALKLAPGFFAPLDHTLNDWRTFLALDIGAALHPNKAREQRVVIVDIDEKSLAKEGPWPWSRAKVSGLVENLIDYYGAAGVTLDIVFPEVKDFDAQLEGQLQRSQVTGAVVYDFLGRGQAEVSKGLAPRTLTAIPDHAPRSLGLPVSTNHPGLMPKRLGHITPLFDSDGSIRHLPPFACHSQRPDECRPLLGISSFLSLLSEPSLEMTEGRGLFAPAWQVNVIEARETTLVKIPVNADGTIVVPYRHRQQDWLAISATDILQKKVKPEDLRGSLVLIGATALGMSDVVVTPVSSVASGLEPHAEVMVALLDNSFFFAPKYADVFVFILLLPLATLLYFALKRATSPMQRAVIVPVWMCASWLFLSACALLAYMSIDVLLPLNPMALFPLFTTLAIGSLELYLSTREKVGVSGLLAAYLPKQVADKLTERNHQEGKMDTSVDASRRQITVMFADVRGFTGLAEGHHPEIVARLMHRVFSEMAASVVSHGGTIDKFIGDAVMAFWNAPEDDPLHALHALASAQDMIRRMHQLAAYCDELGVPHVKIGIGIETGYALVGNFGSEHRRTYTALGETVVLASRIEGLTAQYNRAILIGEACAAALHGEGLEPLGEVQIRGRQRVLALYSPRHMPANRVDSDA